MFPSKPNLTFFNIQARAHRISVYITFMFVKVNKTSVYVKLQPVHIVLLKKCKEKRAVV